MKSLCKKLFCLFLILVMVTALTVNTFSLGITSDSGSYSQDSSSYDQYVLKCLPDLFSLLSSDADKYGLSDTELESISVSSSFTISGTQNNEKYYALMSGNEVLGIITVSYTGGKFYLTYAKDFADNLNQLYTSRASFSLSWEHNDNEPSSLVVQSSTNLEASISTSLSNKLVSNVSANSNLTTSSATRSTNDSGELTGTFPLIFQNYPVYNCSCSVACAKAMAQYFDSSLSSKSLGDVIYEVYGWQEIPCAPYFLPLSRATEVFDEYVSNSYLTFNYGLTLQGMKNQINSNNPTMCIAESPDDEDSYHSTVITGYSYGSQSSSYMIDMMDPYTPSWRVVFWDGTGELSYSFNGYQKVWRKTIVLYS